MPWGVIQEKLCYDVCARQESRNKNRLPIIHKKLHCLKEPCIYIYQTNGYPRKKIFYGIFCNVAGIAKKTKHYQFRSAVPLSNIRGHQCVKFPAFCNKVTARLNSWSGLAIKRFQIKLGGFAFVPVSNVNSNRYYIIKFCFGTKSKATSTSNVMDNLPDLPMFSGICRNGKWTSSCNLSVTNSAPEWLHDSYINVFFVATVL